MFLPNSLYEALPILYILAGLAVMFLIGGTLAILSGGLLTGIGAAIILMRRRNREAIKTMDRKERQRRRQH